MIDSGRAKTGVHRLEPGLKANPAQVRHTLGCGTTAQQPSSICKASGKSMETSYSKSKKGKAAPRHTRISLFVLAFTALLALTLVRAAQAEKPIVVNVDNFVKAHTSSQFGRIMMRAGGINQISHLRAPVPFEYQNVARMNRDTLYSSAIVDVSKGATLDYPDAGDRYMSVAIVNEDNYTTGIYHGGGTVNLSAEEHGSAYLMVVARYLVNPNDPEDLKAVHALQDELKLVAASSVPYSGPNYDPQSKEITQDLLKKLGNGIKDARYCNGKKSEVRETRHMLCAAYGWGGLPSYEVVYTNHTTPRPMGFYQLKVKDVPVKGFWSISVYNEDGFFVENDKGSYNINSVIAEADDNGSVTVNFSACEKGEKNCIVIMEGWNYVARFYLPSEEIQSGGWRLPEPTRLDSTRLDNEPTS